MKQPGANYIPSLLRSVSRKAVPHTLAALFVFAASSALAAQYLNSAEPLCDGTDPTVLMCDDFEDGSWYVTDADNGGQNSPANDGWDGHVFADDDDGNGHARCGRLGAAGTNCTATSGYRSGSRYEGIHEFGPSDTKYDEIYHRFYTKFSAGYQFGHEKLVFYQNNDTNSGQVAVIMTPFGTNTLDFTIIDPDERAGQNLGNKISLDPEHWYYIEVHIRIANAGGNGLPGLVEMWADDCGTDGLGCTGPGTLRLTYNKLASTSQLGVIWQENWANSGDAIGEVYNDQVVVRMERIGPMEVIPPLSNIQPPSNVQIF